MTLVLDLPGDLEAALAAEAAHLSMPLEEYALCILAVGRLPDPRPRTGAELVAYWQREGLIGSRPNIMET